MSNIGRRLGVAALLWIAIASNEAMAQKPAAPLVPNGSFEEGDGARPASWTSGGAGEWAEGDARRGRRFLRTTSAKDERAWQSSSLPLAQDADYRLEGWLRSGDGEARLSIELLNPDGQVAIVFEAPHVSKVSEWRYVAVDFRGNTAPARIVLTGQGTADFDEVALAPIAVSYLGNRDLQPDNRGRIGFWSEEKESKIASGNRAGSHKSDPMVKRRELPALVLESTGDWYALSSVNYNVPAFTDRIRFTGWARAGEGSAAQLLACWIDDSQQVLRVDASDEARGERWRQIVLAPESPPAGAYAVRVVALARGGRAWFDEMNLEHMRPSKRVVRVFANQVGCELAGPKSAVIATNFFPEEGSMRADASPDVDHSTLSAEVVDGDGKPVYAARVPSSGRIYSGKPDDWGWYFWRFDFSKLDKPGKYRVVATSGDARGDSHPFSVERSALLKDTAFDAINFFFVQRCGCEVPGWHKACHMDDARLPDGTHLDVSGGWHSAGDYNKPMWQFGDSGSSYALATAFAARPRYFGRVNGSGTDVHDALTEAVWGADFLRKMQVPDDGSMRGDVLQGPGRTWMAWKAPDEHTDNQVGTTDDPVIAPTPGNAPLTVAAWCKVAQSLSDPAAKDEYVQRALRLFAFLSKSDSATANPLLLIGALELHRATQAETYRDFSRRSVGALLGQQKPTGALPGDSGDHGDVAAAALAMYALQFPDSPECGKIEGALKRYLDFCIARTDNPFGLTRQGTEEPEATYFHPTVGLGVNFWILSRAWAAVLIHRVTHDPRALVYATDQIDWVLGKNPLDLCMFEGHGQVNPPRYHHRYNMIPGRERGAVPGAIANGMVRDMGIADRPGFDLSRAGGRSPSFRTSEPWLVHNMFYLLAASALDESVNGQK